MNWRPASPFDSVLADELVTYACKHHLIAGGAATMTAGYGMTLKELGHAIGRSPEYTRQLSEMGKSLMRRAASDRPPGHPACCGYRDCEWCDPDKSIAG